MKQFSEGFASAKTRAAGQPPAAALAATVSLLLAAAAPVAYSQEKSADAAASPSGAISSGESDAGDIAEVTVTGSRIARPPGYEAPTPVSVLNASDLDKQAVSNVA